MPEGDFHPSDPAHSQAHSYRRKPVSKDLIDTGFRVKHGMTDETQEDLSRN